MPKNKKASKPATKQAKKKLSEEDKEAINLMGLEVIMHESDECGKAHKEPKSSRK